jgi:hypothetical protein
MTPAEKLVSLIEAEAAAIVHNLKYCDPIRTAIEVNKAIDAAGWQIVPKEATEDMRAVIRTDATVYETEDVLYDALLAAAPKAVP